MVWRSYVLKSVQVVQYSCQQKRYGITLTILCSFQRTFNWRIILRLTLLDIEGPLSIVSLWFLLSRLNHLHSPERWRQDQRGIDGSLTRHRTN